MCPDTNDNLLCKLAVLLTEKKVETSTILKSFQLLCDNYSFDCGMVYEVDYSGQFYLYECYAPDTAMSSEIGSPISLDDQVQHFLAQKDIHYIQRDPLNTPLEKHLLDLYSGSSVILAPVTDENSLIYGLIVLAASASTDTPSDEAHRMLSTLLSMLIRYVGTRMYQKKLSLTQTTLEDILNNTGIDIYVNDYYTHDILYVNNSMAAPYGGPDQFLNRKCWEILFPGQTGPCNFCPQQKLIDSSGIPSNVYSWDYQRPFDGKWFRVFSAAFYWIDGRLAHIVSSADISENKHNAELVEYMANYDQLTKLPNRRMLIKECERSINNATDTEQGYILFFDIDGFKKVNDSFGHDAGDEFLIQLSDFFSSIPLLSNSIYRNGGDEFVAVIGGENITKAHIQNLAHFIHERFKNTWHLKTGDVMCNISIGVACYPEDGITAEKLLQKADIAMYQVKKSGGGGLCFGYQIVNDHPSE